MIKISAFIPNYNHSQYLPESIESILNQTYEADEILIIDDGSTDNSIEVIQEFQKKHKKIKLIKNEKNYGIHLTFNKALHILKNEIIAPFSADDFIMPSFFEKAMKLFKENNDLSIVFSNSKVFQDKKPYQFRSISKEALSEQKIIYPDEFIKLSRTKNFHIASCACIYKKKIVMHYGGYRIQFKSLTDYYLNLQIALRHPIAYIPEELSAYRLSPNSYGASIRYNWKGRINLLNEIMRHIRKNEDDTFKKNIFKSGVLSFNGYFMILYIILHPAYWVHFPLIFYKVLERKLSERKKRKSKP